MILYIITNITPEYYPRDISVRGQVMDVILPDVTGLTPSPPPPPRGHCFQEAGVPVGRHMSRVLDRLRQIWIDADFEMTEQQLRRHVPAVMDDLGLTPAAPSQEGAQRRDGRGRGEGER